MTHLHVKTAIPALGAALLIGCLETAAPTRSTAPDRGNELAVAAATTTTYEAEKAVLGTTTGQSKPVVANSKAGFSGTGFVDYLNASGDFIEWSVSVSTAGSYTLVFRYALSGTTARSLKITDGGTTLKSSLSFPASGSWTTWKTVSFSASLGSGTHKIRATAIGTSGPNMDYLQVSGPNTSGAPTASQLLALTSSCNKIGGNYSTDDGSTSNVPVCKLNGAVWWKADMDIDCDGVRTTTCNENTDPWYQPQTSFQTSTGAWLNSVTLPYYVVPLPSSRFDYTQNGIKGGQVAAVIYNGKVIYAVFGDEGPSNIIGEASVATANALGINSNPESGGTDGPVTYIIFTGSTGVISPIEDHNKATSVGQGLASTLIKNN